MADKRGKFDPNNAYGSAVRWVEITPNDTVSIAVRPDAIFAGSDGFIVMVAFPLGTPQDEISVPVVAGQIIPFRPDRILTDSTASPIFALYCQ